MKKNDWSIIISVLLYTMLFYKQDAGINFLLFNVSIICLLLYRNRNLLKSTVWISVALGALVSSFFIFKYSSALAIVANMFSLLILSAISINTRTSFITSIFLTTCSTSSSVVFMILDWIERKAKNISETYSRPFYVKIFLIVIPFLIAIIFFLFYQSANPLFYDFTKKINLDFISIPWILFTIGGLLLMYGFFHNKRMKSIYEIDIHAELVLTPEIASRKNFLNGMMRTDTENLSGIVLFSMLNLLLIVVNVLDVHFLWFDGKLPEGIDNKAFVHKGVGTLITSIITAILIILFYFRGELNFYEKRKTIRWMAYLWILQNAFMIFSTAYRNNMYIIESGISYKKIGVYVYLLLVFIGLVTTFIKVWKIKTNWYLFRINASVYFNILVFSAVFNWDVIITDYNIAKHDNEKKKLEKYFLLDLSYKNLPQLLALPDSLAGTDDYNARDYYFSSRGTYFSNFKSGLAKKLYDFLDDYKTLEWQSICSEKKRVYHDIYEMKNKITELNFYYLYNQSLKPLEIFSNLRHLQIMNEKNLVLNELKYFPLLETLDLSNNQLDTIIDFPPFRFLKQLNLSNNNLVTIASLSSLQSLETLDLSGYNNIKDFSPLHNLQKLKTLTLGRIQRPLYQELEKHLPNVNIHATIMESPYENRN